jgi:hypothetical protein
LTSTGNGDIDGTGDRMREGAIFDQSIGGMRIDGLMNESCVFESTRAAFNKGKDYFTWILSCTVEYRSESDNGRLGHSKQQRFAKVNLARGYSLFIAKFINEDLHQD